MTFGRHEVAEAEVRAEEEEIAKESQIRRFDTTTGTVHCKPDSLQAERAAHCRIGLIPEILHGPTPDRTRSMDNRGLDFPSHAHYTNMEPVTHARMCMDDQRLKSDVKVTAANGVNAFGKNAEFTKPLLEFTRGLAKDEELDLMFGGLQKSQPLRHIGGHVPRGPFAEIPSLATVKVAMHAQIEQAWGPFGYVLWRQRLFEVGDQEGFVHKEDVTTIFRDEMGLDPQQVSDAALDVYLSQLATMRKADMRIGAVIASVRPVIPQKQKRRVLEAFKAMRPVNGEIRLGDWLSQLQDENLRATVVRAFGAQDETQVEGLTVSEPVFTELLADLAPFMDVEALLVA